MDPMFVTSAQIALRAIVTDVHSALPDAPVVAHVEQPPPALRTRTALARGLRRAADAVAPRRPVGLCLDS